jgi:hypothetical protein
MWRRVVRELTTWGMLVSVLALLGGVVWATYHPGHPLLARAAGWPAVGPLVERFRAHYGVGGEELAAAGEAPGESGEGGVEVEWRYQPIGGAVAAPSAEEAPRPGGTRVWVAAGEALRRAPDAAAEVLARQDVFERVAVLERSGSWARVATRVGEGWVEAAEEAGGYPLGSGVRPNRPLASAPPDPAQLLAARELLGVDGPSGHLGPYVLYTDVQPPSRLFHLDRLAAAVDPVYRRRYGRAPAGEPEEAVLVFSSEAGYRLFQSREARIAGLPSGGHHTAGVVALWSGGRQRHELAATLVHELVHVLNLRALGPALPPWLDEGLADDLAASEVGPAGELRPERLGGLVVRDSGRMDYFGAVAALRHLNTAFARSDPPRLEELVELSWDGFVRSERRDLHYAHAGFFIRYLVDGEDGELAPGFRRFLDRVADGGPATGEALRDELGWSWERLDRGLGDFVRAHILETTPTSAERRDQG